MKDHLIFDTTNATTIADCDSVGAYVRANDGTLITKHSLGEDIKASLISQGLIFKSKLAGTVGNAYTFQVVDIGAGLSYTELAGAIVVDLGGTTPTSAQVATLLGTSAYVDVSVGTPTGNVIVAGSVPFTGGENSNFHQHLDVYSATADGLGNPILSTGGSLNVNMTNAINVDIDGIYVAGPSNNPNPDNTGIIAHTRTASPGDVEQVERTTAALAGLNGVTASTIHGLDVNSSLMAINSADTSKMDSLKSTSNALWVNIQNTTVSVSDAALANTSIVSAAEVGAAINVSKDIIAAPLADRKYVWIYNNDNQKIWIGGTGVLPTNGFPISPGSYMELRAGSAVDIEFVSTKASAPIRTLELK